MDVRNIIYQLLFFYVCYIKSEDEIVIDEICSIDDDECMTRNVNSILSQMGEKNIPGLPSIDPLAIADVTFTFLNSIDLTLEHGYVEKLKTCRYEKSSVNINKMEMDFVWECDIDMEGNFTLKGSNPLIQAFLKTDSISGKGYLNFVMEKLRLDLSLPFKLERKDDGKIYVNTEEHKPKFVYDVKKAVINTKDLFIGDQDFSKLINMYFNSNWEFILQNVGKQFFGVIAEVYVSLLHKIFMKIPTDALVIEDLSSYV